jgi:hypothetical protein
MAGCLLGRGTRRPAAISPHPRVHCDEPLGDDPEIRSPAQGGPLPAATPAAARVLDRSGETEPTARVIPTLHGGNYRTRHFDPVCAEAGLSGFTPKDLRDTFASQLFTCGVQLGYISRQLGHADTVTTAKCYAKWIDVAGYREPVALEPGELPVDLIQRVCRSIERGLEVASRYSSGNPVESVR